METEAQTSEEGLCAAILAQARQERDRIIAVARQQAQELLAAGVAEADRVKAQKLARARAEAQHYREVVLARVPMEVEQERRAAVETLLETVRTRVSQQLDETKPLNQQPRQVALAADAIGRMSGGDFVVKLGKGAGQTDTNALVRAISAQVGRSGLRLDVAEDPTLRSGGVRVESASGHQVWDNTGSARLERLWPELRRQIALRLSLVRSDQVRGDRPC